MGTPMECPNSVAVFGHQPLQTSSARDTLLQFVREEWGGMCRRSSRVTLPSNLVAVAGSSRQRRQSANPNQRTLKLSTSSGLRSRMPTWVGSAPQMQHSSDVARIMLKSASVRTFNDTALVIHLCALPLHLCAFATHVAPPILLGCAPLVPFSMTESTCPIRSLTTGVPAYFAQ